MRKTFDLFWRALERRNFLLLSHLHVTILVLWSQGLFPRTGWTVVHPRVSPFLFDLRLRLCLQFLQALTHNSGWILVHPRVSPFLTIGFLVLVGFVGCPCCFQLLLNPILSSNYLWRKSLEEAEVTHILSRMWFLQIPSQQLSRYNKLGVYREGWLHYILFDRIWILYVEQAVIDPIHRVLVSFPRFLLVPCKLVRIFLFLVHGIHSREEYCLSFPVWILSSRYQSWIDDGV